MYVCNYVHILLNIISESFFVYFSYFIFTNSCNATRYKRHFRIIKLKNMIAKSNMEHEIHVNSTIIANHTLKIWYGTFSASGGFAIFVQKIIKHVHKTSNTIILKIITIQIKHANILIIYISVYDSLRDGLLRCELDAVFSHEKSVIHQRKICSLKLFRCKSIQSIIY